MKNTFRGKITGIANTWDVCANWKPKGCPDTFGCLFEKWKAASVCPQIESISDEETFLTVRECLFCFMGICFHRIHKHAEGDTVLCTNGKKDGKSWGILPGF